MFINISLTITEYNDSQTYKEGGIMLAELVAIGALGLTAYLKGTEIKGKIDKSEGDSFGEKAINMVNGSTSEIQGKYEKYREDAERDLENYGVERLNEIGKAAITARNFAKAKAYSDVYNENK